MPNDTDSVTVKIPGWAKATLLALSGLILAGMASYTWKIVVFSETAPADIEGLKRSMDKLSESLQSRADLELVLANQRADVAQWNRMYELDKQVGLLTQQVAQQQALLMQIHQRILAPASKVGIFPAEALVQPRVELKEWDAPTAASIAEYAEVQQRIEAR